MQSCTIYWNYEQLQNISNSKIKKLVVIGFTLDRQTTWTKIINGIHDHFQSLEIHSYSIFREYKTPTNYLIRIPI